MRVCTLSLVVLFLGFVSVGLCATFPQPQVAYSADQYTDVSPGPNGGPMSLQGRIFHADGKERRETRMMGTPSVLISRPDKGLTWVLMPQQKMYMEYTDDQMDTPTDLWRKADVEMKQVGTETITTINTTKYRVRFHTEDGHQSDGFVWLSPEKIPVKAEGKAVTNGIPTVFQMRIKNLKIEPQPDRLFEIPTGYTLFEMPATR